MKKNLLLIFFFLFSLSNSQINTGLKAFYPFNGNTNDHSGGNHHARIVGNLNLTDDRFGTPNSAYQFPGNSTNYIAVDYASDYNTSPSESFSISLWYKGGSVSGGDFEILFGKENPQLNYKPYDYYLGLYDSNKVVGGGNGYEVLWSTITPPQPDPHWHHIVFIYDNKNWYLYQDNILNKSNTNHPVSQSTNGLVMGKNFQGIIDDVRFYNRKLTDTEIDELYKLNLTVNDDSKNSDLIIFPNPTSGILNVRGYGNETLQVLIYDRSGKQIFSQQYSEKQINIDLSKLPDGIYTLKTVSGKSVKSKLIIKKD
ncbi:LamG-like jellyroll fold domain-containing protein [Kaistella sp.]|uniref:LamG-like jellyroll fold domain-containing protein n=1 Tax=Kaistella sp. TaxID=2782235 RepID=UPI002F95F450